MTISNINRVPFFIANAFTGDLYGGNPAAVVFLQEDLPSKTLLNIARNFNQPMTTFIFPPAVPDEPSSLTATFRVRWFTAAIEAPLCGHGTLAAAGVIFSTPGLAAAHVQSLSFRGTSAGKVLSARKVDNQVEITLLAGTAERVSATEEERVGGIVKRALGDISVRSVWVGSSPAWCHFAMVEVEEKQKGDLASRKVNEAVFLETGYPSNIITASSSDTGVAFISRVFAPADGVGEDPVCGSAHCLMVPFWAEKLGYEENQVTAKQVSARGGELKVKLDKTQRTITLRGSTRTTTSGDIYL